MDWIDIKDQLPEDNQLVRIRGSFPFEICCNFKKTGHGYIFILLPRRKDGVPYEFYGITHWMPLPKPPEV